MIDSPKIDSCFHSRKKKLHSPRQQKHSHTQHAHTLRNCPIHVYLAQGQTAACAKYYISLKGRHRFDTAPLPSQWLTTGLPIALPWPWERPVGALWALGVLHVRDGHFVALEIATPKGP